MWALALATMVLATLAQHLGLTGAVAGVVSRIARCHKCCSFWCTLSVLMLYGCGMLESLALALLAAYLSHWLGLALIVLQGIYNSLWERLERNRRKG